MKLTTFSAAILTVANLAAATAATGIADRKNLTLDGADAQSLPPLRRLTRTMRAV